MPIRKEIVANGEIYHMFNRGVDGRQVFQIKVDRRKLIVCWWFYRCKKLPIKPSRLSEVNIDQRTELINSIVDSPKRVDILAYCLMNNHFHLLIRQLDDRGIEEFMSHSTNSYTRWFNERTGR